MASTHDEGVPAGPGDQALWMFNPVKITEMSLPADHASPVRFTDVRAPRQ